MTKLSDEKHAIQIVGAGSFGLFLRTILAGEFTITEDEAQADSIILAIPHHAYESVGSAIVNRCCGCHLVNVCSIQSTTTAALLRFSSIVTSIHPLFGKRTPADRRNSLLTHSCGGLTETSFLDKFGKISTIYEQLNGETLHPHLHDRIMAKTHVAAVMAAMQMKVYIDRAKDIPDEFVPNSFRLLREFVKTLDDMPKGTVESIMANPYF